MALACPQPPVGIGHGRGHLLFGHVAVDVEVEAAVVGVAPVSYTHLDVYKRQDAEGAEKKE